MNMNNGTLNSDQKLAFHDVILFINDPARKYHRISGGAGTGKSFLICQIIDNILKHQSPKILTEVFVTATTNKAASVLKNQLPHWSTQISTIYAAMNLRVQNDFKTGTNDVIPTAKWKIHDCVLIIIDEASMANAKLCEYIEKGTTDRCKILFVGDKNQLAPVGESISPIYRNNYSESFLNMSVRQQNQPALMRLADQARKTVLSNEFFKIEPEPGVIDLIDGNQLRGVLERTYTAEDSTKRLLCYTNSRVREYNNYIRKLRGYTENYAVNEILTNNSSAELSDRRRMYTDQVVQVMKRGKPYSDPDIVPNYTIDMIDLEVRCVESNAEYQVTVTEDPNDREEVLKFWRARKKWHKYFKFQDQYPDLRSVAASTTHKAQGSTFTEIIVDLSDIGKSTQLEQTARLLYVALTRPTDRLYIRGALPDRYFP